MATHNSVVSFYYTYSSFFLLVVFGFVAMTWSLYSYNLVIMVLLTIFATSSQSFVLKSVHSKRRAFPKGEFVMKSVEKGFKKFPVIIGTIGLLTLSPILDKYLMPEHAWVVNADSTGKMSTKLTAKKRYLPRILEGYRKFQSLLVVSDDKIAPAEKIKVFAADDLPGLKRAMSLYGASLRKGEVPDEISREAEQLTLTFEAAFQKLSTSKTIDSDYNLADNAFKSYLSFAKISL